MRATPTELDGVLLITTPGFRDHRGEYIEIFDSDAYRDACAGITFVQDDISKSKAGVLRGVHGDFVTTKLVSVLDGTGYAVLADNRPASKTYRRWQAFVLSGDNRRQLLIPPGVGNSILALDDIVYWYKQSTHFVPGRQFTIRWDDPEWGFVWPTAAPILSARDQEGRYVTAS
jgi:dTDP-4-dehydrorhamnose 3,5-epimerase